MLKTRPLICILLLLASALPEAVVYAQNDEPTGSERQRKRLGDSPVQVERDLDLTVPSQDEKSSDSPGEEQLTRQQLIDRQLAAATAALQAGRIDQPPDDCAWSHYRKVLDIDPENEEALQGLIVVQEAMVARAVEAARILDFESAERFLEDAALVRESEDSMDGAQQQIRTVRALHVEKLEVEAVQAMDAGNFTQAEHTLAKLNELGGADSTVNPLRRRLEEARVYGGFKSGQIIRDHFINQGLWTPESVVVLAGSYTMGSSAFEDGRQDGEGPTHRVTFRRGFVIGRTEVTVKEFRLFVDKTGYRTDAEKQNFSTVYNHYSGQLARRDGVNWKMNYEGEEAEKNEPVVHVSWNDAMAYVKWLARGTSKPYRLPSEAEFEYAVRAGRTTRYWWGDDVPHGTVENLAGEHDVSRSRRQWSPSFKGYGDKFWGPAPVASFDTNPFGLHDIAGNVSEWVRDCWHDSYFQAPADGSARLSPDCKLRIVRGGHWASSPDLTRSAHRLSAQPDLRNAQTGFRIARDL
jgi:formylglycine-generating enzyme required for sulfatase activity